MQECMAIGDVRILHVPSTSQFMNIIMKGLQTSLFSYFRSSLNIHSDYSFDCVCGGGALETCCIMSTWVRDNLLCEA
jgi:hypothetical protein